MTALNGRHKLKGQIHSELLGTLDLREARNMPVEQLHRECTRRLDGLLSDRGLPLSAPEKNQLLREVMDEIFGLGPLERFLREPDITDILANGANRIYVERRGRLELTDASFRDESHLLQIIQRIASRVGRRIDESSPMLDARLEDGSRVNAIIAPLALDGPALSIRRFGDNPVDVDTLLRLKSITEEMVSFLQACVRGKLNILISGGTGSGKTTLLNVLSSWVPSGERLITIEDAAELRLQREHVVRLETRPPNIEDTGEITQRDLLRNSLRMRPDRILIGEVRSAEALDMLQAMNTGHEGSMTTVHANNARDALRRIENMVSMAGLQYPVHVIRQQMASALNVVVHLSRLTGGARRVVGISEVSGMEGEQICLQEIFRFRQSGVDADGDATGQFEACGVRPRTLEQLLSEGFDLPPRIFTRRVLETVGGDAESMAMTDAGQIINLLIVGSAFGLVLSVWLIVMLLWVLRRSARASKIDARLAQEGSGGWENAEPNTASPGVPATPPSPSRGKGSNRSGLDRILTGAAQFVVSIALTLGVFLGALLFLQSTLLAAGLAVATFVAVRLFVGHHSKRRASIFEQQLVEALELASRSLRAGHPLTSAFELISTEMERPVADVFAGVCQQHAMGAELDQALSKAAVRSGSPDLRLLSTSIAIQSRTGGNVAQLMDRIALVTRERIRLGRRLRVLTAQTQLSKRILIALPVIVFFVFGLINREYMDPFYATMTGRIMLAVAIALLALGAWVMNRMTALKY